MTLPGIWSQRDARWGSDTLGNNPGKPWTLYSYGCLVTSIAGLLWALSDNPAHTPGWTNGYLRDHGAFTQGGGEVIWGVLDSLLPAWNLHAHGYSSDLAATNNWLAPENNYALVWLSKDGFPMHWALMPFVGMIADPWDGKLKPVSAYTFHGAHWYSFAVPAAAPVEAKPQPGPMVAPAVPVPSTETPVVSPVPEAPSTAGTYYPAFVIAVEDRREERRIRRPGAYAIDLQTGDHVVDNITLNSPVQVAQIVTTARGRFVRTQTALEQGWWNGLPEEFTQDPPTPIKVPVVHEPDTPATDENDPLGLIGELDRTTRVNLFKELIDWFGRVAAAFSKNKKGIN